MEPAGQAKLAVAGVTGREAEVLELVGGRLSNREIAGRLCISVRTVESHVSALLRKLAATDRSALVALAGQLAAGPARPDAALAGPAAGRAYRPAQLPSAIRGFTGRRPEIADLDARLADASSASSADSWPTVVISAVSGTAGIGKTALAVQWAHRVADQFPDGQLFANLRGFDPDRPPAEPGAVLRGFLEALGASAARIPDDLDAQAALFRSMLADRRVLVVLDNARDSNQVRPLLPGAPGCLAVVTSRNRLASLAALEGACLLPLDLLTHAEARELFAGRLGRDRVQAGGPAVDEIIAACAGLPLALAIVAGRAASQPRLPLAAVAAELRGATSALDAIRGEDTVTDLRAVFSWSVDALSLEAARMFRLLGLHPGPDLTAPAAASLAAQSPGQCAAVLAELVGAHLVGEPVPGRYALHDLLRAYAAELAGLETETERSEARRRMFDHYLHTAHAGALQTGPLMESITMPEPGPEVVPEQLPDENQAMTWFRAEHAVLMTTVEEAAARGFARHAWQLAWCIDTPLHRASRWRDEVRVHTVGAESARAAGQSVAAATVTLLLGRGLSELRQWDAAEQAVLEALRLYRARGDARLEAHALIYLGLVAFERGRIEHGVAITRQAAQLCQETGEQLGLGTALGNLAEAHYVLGEYQHARDLSHQALEVHGQTGNRDGAICCWLALGNVERDAGHTTQALRCYRTAAQLSREIGHMLRAATALTRLGDVQDVTGHRPAAERSWREALAILTDLDHPDTEGLLRRLATSPDKVG
jgi:DNA-binding CsgD family transcriptional regulator/tetratricopeptide (TPR) repeat protein